ncbi:hypothetical protein HDV57DRAFT_32647 [Trichoderma longibrachiatum]|uniref:Uncharacterized protein n=1 Tax=Trichoderma longibrachiatum ATCC 18648 TaxID=983965 RepID=A0A2T4CHW6_TRILO|nr:hypothetical protein M440DRAFT_1008695 [Trichoderma longibrachiatum ATCC 18648]
MFPANHRRGRLRQCWERISGCLGLKYGRSRLFFCGEKIKDKERERERDGGGKRGNIEREKTTLNPCRHSISTQMHASDRSVPCCCNALFSSVCATCSIRSPALTRSFLKCINELMNHHRSMIQSLNPSIDDPSRPGPSPPPAAGKTL